MEKSMNKPTAIAVGFSCVDIYEKLDKFYPTGNGVDWGVHLSRMGIPVSILSVVGTDAYGAKMKEALTKEGFDISHLRTAQGETCKMLMDLKNGVDRVHLEEIEGVMKDFALSEEDKAYIKTFDYMHTDLFGNVLPDLKELHESGIQIVMDFSTFSDEDEFHAKDCFEYVDYAFLSYEQEDDYILQHIKNIQAHGPKIVTATLGENGSVSYDGKQYYHCGIEPVEVVNTVGAGDSYIAGFTYGIMMGWDIPACMKNGAHTSAGVITKFEPY
ncbi:MAG: fructoselysine 6-kinase [Erysipelotrichaceae bacterium]|nr:fructoselysine 6-kinase [Erysipelotrichaceae bacterium]